MATSGLFYVAFGIFLFSLVESSADTPTCVAKITAALTEEQGFGYYLFAGSKYTYYNRITLTQNPNTTSQMYSALDWEGMHDDVTINAGYMNPDAENTMIFAGSQVFKVDILKKKVLEQKHVDTLFTEDERKHITRGIQATAYYNQDVYYFSGCKLLVKHPDGTHEAFGLTDKGLPCDVDSAFNYPKRGSPNLMVIKGLKAYGLMMGAATALAYDLYCVNGHLPMIGMHLCECA